MRKKTPLNRQNRNADAGCHSVVVVDRRKRYCPTTSLRHAFNHLVDVNPLMNMIQAGVVRWGTCLTGEGCFRTRYGITASEYAIQSGQSFRTSTISHSVPTYFEPAWWWHSGDRIARNSKPLSFRSAVLQIGVRVAGTTARKMVPVFGRRLVIVRKLHPKRKKKYLRKSSAVEYWIPSMSACTYLRFLPRY